MSVTELTEVEGSSATDLLERGFNEWMLKFEGRGSREEGKNKIIPFASFLFFTNAPLPTGNWQLAISSYQFPVTNSQFPIRKHIFQRRASSGKNASNQCNHRSGQRVRAVKLLLGSIA